MKLPWPAGVALRAGCDNAKRAFAGRGSRDVGAVAASGLRLPVPGAGEGAQDSARHRRQRLVVVVQRSAIANVHVILLTELTR